MGQKLRWPSTIRGLLLGLLLLGAPAMLQAQQLPRSYDPHKLAPGLQAVPARQEVRAVRVSVTNQAAFRQWAQQYLPGAVVTQPSTSATTLAVAGLSPAALRELAACPVVQFVDVADRRAHEERELSYSDLAANRISLVHARYPQLTGQGLTVSVKEQPFNPGDIDFKGRVVNAAQFPGPASPHATDMATLIAGGGNSAPLGRGAAWQARLTTSDFARLLPDDGQQLMQAGVSVQNHSYGVTIENYYGLDAVEYDRHCRQFPTLLHVFSAGNVGSQASTTGIYAGLAGFANLTGQFKMSKNTLSVGATDLLGQTPAMSSRGPAYDGRVKPELVAYGDGGTSEAAALVSGISLLVQQAYQDQHGGTLPPAAAVKAALLNSADDKGRPAVDFVTGFGQADALGAVQTMRDNRLLSGTAAATGADQVFTITVPAGQQELKATLVWADPEALPNATRALVNDLDLELVLPATGQRWRPWVLSSYPRADSLALPARRGADHLNNVEQITLATPGPGTYELHVRGYSVPVAPQAFSLAYEFSAPGFEWVRPLENQNLEPAANGFLRWQWQGPLTNAQLQYRPVGAAGWRLIAPAVSLSQQVFAWAVPDTTTLAQLRFVTLNGSIVFLSDTFSIGKRPRMEVGYTCDDETLMHWAPVPGASEYQVYRLGATQLEPYLRTTDTTLVLNRAQMQSLYYAVAPIVQGWLLERGNTINYTEQGTACYFRSFRVRQLVSDTIHFDVELGSVARLRAATLERLGPGGYQGVQALAPVPGLTLVFTDLPPVSDRYLYRVRLETLAGQLIYSQPEEAFRVRPGSVLAFPNPVVAGTTLTLIGPANAALTVRLYDMLGRFVREAVGEGVANEIDTRGLRQGIYLLRVRPAGQAEQTLRVVVLN
jgi:hypothetical protein